MASSISPGSMLAVGATFPALSILAVSARFCIRVYNKHGLRADDWLIVPAMIVAVAIGVCIILGVKEAGLGHQLGYFDITTENGLDVAYLGKLETAITLLFLVNQGAAKLSMLFFYRRVFCTGNASTFSTITKVLACIIPLWATSIFFASLFACGTDIQRLWGPYAYVIEYCANTEAINLFSCSMDVLLDVILFILPIKVILRLRLSTSRRLGVLFVFAIGALALVASIIRLAIYGLIFTGFGNNFVGGDPLVVIGLEFYWIMFESGMAVIAACLPVLQVCFRKISIEAVSKNVRGIFSMNSTSRFSKKSSSADNGLHKTTIGEDSHSSLSNLNHSGGIVELREFSVRSDR